MCVLFTECSMNVHHKCVNKVANLCGVNQKMMSEALSMIRSTQQVRVMVKSKNSHWVRFMVITERAQCVMVVVLFYIFQQINVMVIIDRLWQVNDTVI